MALCCNIYKWNGYSSVYGQIRIGLELGRGLGLGLDCV